MEKSLAERIVAYRPLIEKLVSRSRLEPAEDLVQQIIYEALQCGARGLFRDEHPGSLAAFVAAIARNQMYRHIHELRRERRLVDRHINGDIYAIAYGSPDPNAEQYLISQSPRDELRCSIDALTARNRELATRAFLDGESPAETQRAMGLTQTQYRLRKSRVKAQIVLAMTVKKPRKPTASEGLAASASGGA